MGNDLFLSGLSAEQKDRHGLMSPEKYFYLNQGGGCAIDGKNDREDFEATMSAMQVCIFAKMNIFVYFFNGKSVL